MAAPPEPETGRAVPEVRLGDSPVPTASGEGGIGSTQITVILDSLRLEIPYRPQDRRLLDLPARSGGHPVNVIQTIEDTLRRISPAVSRTIPDFDPEQLLIEIGGSVAYLRQADGTVYWPGIARHAQGDPELDVSLYYPEEWLGDFLNQPTLSLVRDALESALHDAGLSPDLLINPLTVGLGVVPYHPDNWYFGSPAALAMLQRYVSAHAGDQRERALSIYQERFEEAEALLSHPDTLPYHLAPSEVGLKATKRLLELAHLRGDQAEALQLFRVVTQVVEERLADPALRTTLERALAHARPPFAPADIPALVRRYEAGHVRSPQELDAAFTAQIERILEGARQVLGLEASAELTEAALDAAYHDVNGQRAQLRTLIQEALRDDLSPGEAPPAIVFLNPPGNRALFWANGDARATYLSTDHHALYLSWPAVQALQEFLETRGERGVQALAVQAFIQPAGFTEAEATAWTTTWRWSCNCSQKRRASRHPHQPAPQMLRRQVPSVRPSICSLVKQSFGTSRKSPGNPRNGSICHAREASHHWDGSRPPSSNMSPSAQVGSQSHSVKRFRSGAGRSSDTPAARIGAPSDMPSSGDSTIPIPLGRESSWARTKSCRLAS
jgi:hypothetical protein